MVQLFIFIQQQEVNEAAEHQMPLPLEALQRYALSVAFLL
jgi:hypothetical protein